MAGSSAAMPTVGRKRIIGKSPAALSTDYPSSLTSIKMRPTNELTQTSVLR
jgi:hypothetical protein